MPARPFRDLVLIGGGHTHVQILRRLAMEPIAGARVTLVVDVPIAVYSGMVPGCIAGQYRSAELEIDVVPLARRAGARVILAACVGLDPVAKRIALDGRPDIAYDVASFDIGSTVAGLDLPGVRAYALASRPIGRFVAKVDGVLDRASRPARHGPYRVVVVGAGAGGVELAFTLGRRLRAAGVTQVDVRVLHGGDEILPGAPSGLIARVRHAAAIRGVGFTTGVRVVEVTADQVVLDDGRRLPHDLLLWVTGAASQPLFAEAGLAVDDRGFVLVRPTLQTLADDDLFAVGDCATLVEHPDTPKAGVYAVRQGPYLFANLQAHLRGLQAHRPGGRLRSYRPQSDFLALLNLGDGTALGSRSGVSFGGAWVWRLKDWIDRRFMTRFQVLDEAGTPTPEFAAPAMAGAQTMGRAGSMSAGMLCGGCAAKIGQPVLDRVVPQIGADAADPSVVLGLATPDDVAAVRTPGGELVVSSIDAFPAFTDDPYLVGRIAAVNAASDVLVKGVAPRHALALVALPNTLDDAAAERTLLQVMAGARDGFAPLGITVIGGHTTTAAALLVGFTVTGFAADCGDTATSLLLLDRLQVGQSLVLTKPLGTGVLFNADMQGRARGPWIAAALAEMVRDNQTAARIVQASGATAATDVTGFGLAGHLSGMVRASGVSAIVEVDALPALDGALELFAQGIFSTSHGQNRQARKDLTIQAAVADHLKLPLLFDPQTAGGVLAGVPADRAAAAVAQLRAEGHPAAAIIGTVSKRRADGVWIDVG